MLHTLGRPSAGRELSPEPALVAASGRRVMASRKGQGGDEMPPLLGSLAFPSAAPAPGGPGPRERGAGRGLCRRGSRGHPARRPPPPFPAASPGSRADGRENARKLHFALLRHLSGNPRSPARKPERRSRYLWPASWSLAPYGGIYQARAAPSPPAPQRRANSARLTMSPAQLMGWERLKGSFPSLQPPPHIFFSPEADITLAHSSFFLKWY